ncbi:hypothetical protein SPRG_20871 [Saprolegnia parasitica CBS 223.65]|uniref:Uncharacterized protein n=1 Tax=Saprolegnia parasitica (strain CBS 223.65) TaxID=695850 RepID=A0A067C0H1_SAPPC|nr:hypothetical protein SPRG_20871 [Saprolegnia parasitica CBS 223.65]KDO24254.1 hypothetical protein SPRG_20871 [Saprolegnia parasitica CBS 223.65]|eukprot:XP_012205072.1 hypothetical protein SPRG_20871 [Saprolegnia parasitica CBS 223.65]
MKLDKIVAVEIVVRILCVLYCVFLYGMVKALTGKTIDMVVMSLTYIMIATCPCLWGLIRCLREWARRKPIVVVQAKPKKKPDIATKKEIQVAQTQAEILAAQREKAKELGGLVEKSTKSKKKKGKTPTRKGPPKAKKDKTDNV